MTRSDLGLARYGLDAPRHRDQPPGRPPVLPRAVGAQLGAGLVSVHAGRSRITAGPAGPPALEAPAAVAALAALACPRPLPELQPLVPGVYHPVSEKARRRHEREDGREQKSAHLRQPCPLDQGDGY